MNKTNAERLESIKKREHLYIYKNDDREWLIEQAEHTEKLVKLYQEQGTSLSNRSHDNHALKEENKRLREALEFYADRDNYYQSMDDRETGYPPEIMNDTGYAARKVLEVKSN